MSYYAFCDFFFFTFHLNFAFIVFESHKAWYICFSKRLSRFTNFKVIALKGKACFVMHLALQISLLSKMFSWVIYKCTMSCMTVALYHLLSVGVSLPDSRAHCFGFVFINYFGFLVKFLYYNYHAPVSHPPFHKKGYDVINQHNEKERYWTLIFLFDHWSPKVENNFWKTKSVYSKVLLARLVPHCLLHVLTHYIWWHIHHIYQTFICLVHFNHSNCCWRVVESSSVDIFVELLTSGNGLR